ncbi:MAG: DUF2868 domain-containing protein [Proteobacteria bacterium]|nr:DUF2868 domain-containing protein [Pseudomonadota bacterium]
MYDANSLRSILLVKNVEEQDPDGSVLPLAERDAATRDALRRHPAGNGDGAVHAWQVLATRADSLRAKLAERHPVVTRAVGLESQLAGVGGLVLLAAFGLGLALSLLDSRVRIEILAFPLLGVVLWNLVVYAVLAVSSLRREPAPPAGSTSMLPGWTLWPARWTWQRAARLIKQSSFYHRPLSAALRRFSDEWWPIAQPLLVWQGKRLFHFGSAVVALGLIAGFYLRGIALEYRAGWESTFLGAEQVRVLLGMIYGPASVITGIQLPADDVAVASLHWRNGEGGGPAAPWIHLMAATAIFYVIVPRLLLALTATLRLTRAGAKLAAPESLLPYARRTLGASDAALPAQTTRLTCFAYQPAAASEQGVQRVLRAAFGADSRIEFAPAVAYGEEERFSTPASGAASDLEILLFSLAATPEVENHGRILQLAQDRWLRAKAGSRWLIFVDEAPFLAHFGGDASLTVRIEQRRTAWRDFVRAHGFEACTLDFGSIPAGGEVPRAIVDQVLRSCRRAAA